MPATSHPGVPASRAGQAGLLEALAAELTARGLAAYLAATTPHQPPVLLAGRRGPARMPVLAAPDADTGAWWYWHQHGQPIAPTASPAAAADAITAALADGGRPDPVGEPHRAGGPDGTGGRPGAGNHPPPTAARNTR